MNKASGGLNAPLSLFIILLFFPFAHSQEVALEQAPNIKVSIDKSGKAILFDGHWTLDLNQLIFDRLSQTIGERRLKKDFPLKIKKPVWRHSSMAYGGRTVKGNFLFVSIMYLLKGEAEAALPPQERVVAIHVKYDGRTRRMVGIAPEDIYILRFK